ncbi:hypothetical protein uan_044 [Pseudomonas phage UAntarctica]|nr:hypothetical protein uan_044 [Pseudomonas phage UAntarctica]
MIAAFLLVTSCTLGSPSDCQVFENERWDGPEMVELQDCADMADRLNILFESAEYQAIAAKQGRKVASCEILPMDGGELDDDEVSKVAYRF